MGRRGSGPQDDGGWAAVPGAGFAESAELGAPAAVAFDVLADPAAAPVIDPAVREYRPDTVPMAVGTRTLVRLRLWGLPVRARSVVNAWEPGRRMAMASERPSRPVRVLATHEFADRPGDRCRYTWSVTVQARGRLGRVAAPVLAARLHANAVAQQGRLAAEVARRWSAEGPGSRQYAGGSSDRGPGMDDDGTTMRAVRQEAYGAPEDVLHLGRAPVPTPKDGEVLLKVHAAGVDRGVWHLVTGLPLLVRAVIGLRAPRNPVPGGDVAGRVEAVGAGVTTCAPGDEVYGVAMGSYAEFARARAGKLAPTPAGLTPVQAAAVPVSGLTALQAVRDRGRVEAGQEVLVIGASGGVGTFAVQVAVAVGAVVDGVCSAAKADLVRSLGARHVFDHRTDDPTDGTRRYDVVLDIGGNRPVARLRRALTPTGTLVIVGGEGGGRLGGGMHRMAWAMLRSPFTRQRLGGFVASEKRDDLLALTDLIEAGKVTPAVQEALPLAEAGEALRRLAAGEVRGKLVLTV